MYPLGPAHGFIDTPYLSYTVQGSVRYFQQPNTMDNSYVAVDPYEEIMDHVSFGSHTAESTVRPSHANLAGNLRGSGPVSVTLMPSQHRPMVQSLTEISMLDFNHCLPTFQKHLKTLLFTSVF